VCSNLPCTVHNFTVLSLLAEARYWPSGLKVTWLTLLRWPVKVCSNLPCAVHNFTVLSLLAEARYFPSRLKVTWLTFVWCPVKVSSNLPCAVHNFTVLSALAEARYLPFGLKVTWLTFVWCPVKVCSNLPCAVHNFTVLSPLAEARYLPSGLKVTWLTLLRWPVKVCINLPCAVHNFTVLSSLAEARYLPSRLKLTWWTPSWWPLKVCSNLPCAVHNFTVLSSLAEARYFPSRLKVTWLTEPWWPVKVFTNLPCTVHKFTVLSLLAEARYLPSGLKMTWWTSSLCPLKRFISLGWERASRSKFAPWIRISFLGFFACCNFRFTSIASNWTSKLSSPETKRAFNPAMSALIFAFFSPISASSLWKTATTASPEIATNTIVTNPIMLWNWRFWYFWLKPINSCSASDISSGRCWSFSCAWTKAAPRNNCPFSLVISCHWPIADRILSCQARNSRSSFIHAFSCPQLRIKASWTTSTVSCSAFSALVTTVRLVTTNRASANRLTNFQLVSFNSALVATRLVSSVPSPGRTNWTNIRLTRSCSSGLSLLNSRSA